MNGGEGAAPHVAGDLRGASLGGADLRGLDLRGIDASGADLRGADFTDARLGLRPGWAAGLFVAALVVVAATGALVGWTVDELVSGFADSGWEEVFGRSLAALVLAGFVVAVVAVGLRRAFVVGAIAFVVALGVNYVVLAVASGDVDLARDVRVIGVLLLLAAAMIAGGIARVVGGTFATWAVVVMGLTGGFAAGRAGGGVAGVVVSVILVVLAKRALRMDRRDLFARGLVHQIVARHGTRFHRGRSPRCRLLGHHPDAMRADRRSSRRCRTGRHPRLAAVPAGSW